MPDSYTMDELADCMVTREQTQAELERLETLLARREGLEGTVLEIRHELIHRDIANRLPEDEVVSDWHCTLSSWIDWLEDGAVHYSNHVSQPYVQFYCTKEFHHKLPHEHRRDILKGTLCTSGGLYSFEKTLVTCPACNL